MYSSDAEIFLCAGIERGYYREKGISADLIREAIHQKDCQLSAPDRPAFGLMDAGRLLLYRQSHLKIKAVAAIYSGTLAIVSLSSTGIQEPKGLEGKSLGLTTTGGEYASLPVLAANSGLDLRKVKLVDVEHAGGVNALLRREIDAYAGFFNGSIQTAVVEAARMGETCRIIRYASYGIGYYNAVMVANEKFLLGRRDTAKDFAVQTLKSLAWTIDNPVESLEIYQRYHPEAGDDLAKKRYDALRVLLDNKETRTYGLGWMTEKNWDQLKDALVKNEILIGTTSASGAFTNDFIGQRIMPRAFQ